MWDCVAREEKGRAGMCGAATKKRVSTLSPVLNIELLEEDSQDEPLLTRADPAEEVASKDVEPCSNSILGSWLVVPKHDGPLGLIDSACILGFCHFAYRGDGVSGEEARHRGS